MGFADHTQTHVNDIHALAATCLGVAAQRYTTNRRQLVEILHRSSGPLTIAGILAAESGLPQSSAYRNLTILEEAGVVQRIATSDDHARFELSEMITGQHHHHLICDRCGMIFDVTLPTELEEALEASLNAQASAMGFVGDHHRVDLVGTCAECKASPGAGRSD